MRSTLGLLAVVLLAAAYPAGAAFADPATQPAQPAAADYEERIRPLLARHCLECHGAEDTQGDLRLDELAPDFADRDNVERWLAVLRRVRAGEMPPDSRPRPPQADLSELADWIEGGAAQAVAQRRAVQGRTVRRRLNRSEYENTVRDLLGISVELQDLLPEDASAGGFDNVGAALHTSSFLMERYLEAAQRALGLAIAGGPQPPLLKERYSLKDAHGVRLDTERVFLPRDDTVVMFSSSPWNAVVLSPFYPPDRGLYRFRISASAHQSGGKPVVFRIDAGPMLMATKEHLVGYFDAPADDPAVVEFTLPLEARSTIRILPYGLATAHIVSPIGAAEYTGPGLALHWVEVEGPLHDSWPPPSHRRIFGSLPQAPQADGSVEVVSANPEADAARILRDFARRAFRRAPTDDEMRPLLALSESRREAGASFEQSVRVGLMAVMMSPEFLFLHERPGPLDDFALASRLSYFLWSTMPDEELLRLAERGELARPEALRQQVQRMLADPRAAAFTQNFLGQWLGLRDIDFTEPSHILYPEFDHMLKVSMVRETELFFEEVLRENLSLANFVHSDFSMLNGRLARHYGIAGVEGWEFRKTPLPPESHRGGLLTMASVLKVTANGTSTSPILRGAWVLDRILGTPPSPPPEEVPAIEPDIRGTVTIREQLARHRQIESCASCHARIDPPGFALESFDVIGGWRDHYRTTGQGVPVTLDGRDMPYLQGPPVDPSDVLHDGREFADIDGLKQLLLSDTDQIARALATRLATYATGSVTEDADLPEIESIVERLRGQHYGFRTLVHEIVQSPLFRHK